MEKWLITLTGRQTEFIKGECDRLGVPKSEVVRRLLDEHIDARTSFQVTMSGDGSASRQTEAQDVKSAPNSRFANWSYQKGKKDDQPESH